MDGLLHVVGRAAPGDTTTAAARAVRDALAAEGVPGRLAAVEVHGVCGDVELLRPEELEGATVVLHTVDGGESLAPVLADLRQARVHLVHHGSRAASDRTVLRTLRDRAEAAAATDAAAREELRCLGFGEPAALPLRLPAGAGLGARPETDEAEHPGPLLLAVGAITQGRSLELLVDAFGRLLHAGVPSAVLSICGPADRWYLDALLRRVVRRGLLACEVIEPDDDAAVRSRLDRCDVYVDLHPVGYDPHRWYAAGRAAVVAPAVAATAPLVGAPGFAETGPAPSCDGLVHALRRAVAERPGVRGAMDSSPGTTDLRALLEVA